MGCLLVVASAALSDETEAGSVFVTARFQLQTMANNLMFVLGPLTGACL